MSAGAPATSLHPHPWPKCKSGSSDRTWPGGPWAQDSWEHGAGSRDPGSRLAGRGSYFSAPALPPAPSGPLPRAPYLETPWPALPPG